MKSVRTMLMILCLMTLLLVAAPAQEAEPAAGDAPAADDAVAEPAQEGVLLRLKYEEGEVLTYETTLEGVGSVHIAGTPQPLDMKGKMLVTQTIEAIDDEGIYTVLTEVDVRLLTVTMAGNPVPPPPQDIKVRTKMTPHGEILDVEMLEDSLPQAQQRDLEAQLERLFTGGLDLRRMLMAQRIAAFPEDPVSPGDEWSGSAIDVEVQGAAAPLEIRTKYDGNVQVAGRECARLDSHFAIDAGAFGEATTMLGMRGVTTSDTRSWFDPEEGRLIASMERTQVNMQVNVPAELLGGAQPMGVLLEMFVDSESKLLPPED